MAVEEISFITVPIIDKTEPSTRMGQKAHGLAEIDPVTGSICSRRVCGLWIGEMAGGRRKGGGMPSVQRKVIRGMEKK